MHSSQLFVVSLCKNKLRNTQSAGEKLIDMSSQRNVIVANLLHDATGVAMASVVQWQKRQSQVDVFACSDHIT